jgi:type II secretory pathway component PulM
MIGTVTAWWDGREPRERLLLAVLSALVTVFLIIFAVILPLQAAITTAKADLNRAKFNLALVSRLNPQQGAAAGPRAAFDRSVLITVAREQNVKLTRVQPDGEGSFSVWIDEAETQPLYGFFNGLIGDYAVSVDRVVVSADANGRLSAQFTVQ